MITTSNFFFKNKNLRHPDPFGCTSCHCSRVPLKRTWPAHAHPKRCTADKTRIDCNKSVCANHACSSTFEGSSILERSPLFASCCGARAPDRASCSCSCSPPPGCLSSLFPVGFIFVCALPEMILGLLGKDRVVFDLFLACVGVKVRMFVLGFVRTFVL